jgi:hydrogenase-4 component F
MLAYSSVEHMGILALGVGLAGAGTYGAMLHTINHSLAKAMLFLVAGNILAAYGTKTVRDVRGVTGSLPVSGILWVAGFLAITGTPPFGAFLSEFTILRAALDQHRIGVAAVYLTLLGFIFVAMASIALQMAQGPGSKHAREPLLAILPPAVLAIPVLALGVYIPPPLTHALREIARALGGG